MSLWLKYFSPVFAHNMVQIDVMGGRVLGEEYSKVILQRWLCAKLLGSLKTDILSVSAAFFPICHRLPPPPLDLCLIDTKFLERISFTSKESSINSKVLAPVSISPHPHTLTPCPPPISVSRHNSRLLFFYAGYKCAIFPPAKLNLGSSSRHSLLSTLYICVTHSLYYKCSFVLLLFFKLWCKHWSHGQQGSWQDNRTHWDNNFNVFTVWRSRVCLLMCIFISLSAFDG